MRIVFRKKWKLIFFSYPGANCLEANNENRLPIQIVGVVEKSLSLLLSTVYFFSWSMWILTQKFLTRRTHFIIELSKIWNFDCFLPKQSYFRNYLQYDRVPFPQVSRTQKFMKLYLFTDLWPFKITQKFWETFRLSSLGNSCELSLML